MLWRNVASYSGSLGAMATAGESDGSRRRKRPWRQPRHPVGSGTGSTTPAQSGPIAAASDIAAANRRDKCSSADAGADVKEIRSVPVSLSPSEKWKEREEQRVAELKTESAGEQQRDNSEADERDGGGGVGMNAGVVEIDGSVMEGVSF